MYATLYSAIRPYWHGGRDIRDNRRQLERTQWLSPAELQDWQLERLRALVRHAYDNVPYLRRRYQAAGIQPEDITAFNDFEKLPFMTRDDLNEHLEELVPPEWRGRVEPNSTGGSTGQPRGSTSTTRITGGTGLSSYGVVAGTARGMVRDWPGYGALSAICLPAPAAPGSRQGSHVRSI